MTSLGRPAWFEGPFSTIAYRNSASTWYQTATMMVCLCHALEGIIIDTLMSQA